MLHGRLSEPRTYGGFCDGPEPMRDYYYILGQAVVLLAVIFALIIAEIYVVKRFRDRADQDETYADDMITNSRELHGRGQLIDEEYRTIRTVP